LQSKTAHLRTSRSRFWGGGSPGRFAAVTEDDLATAALERSPSIDILAFVPFAHIDAHYRTYWDTPYLAPPARSADHSYALLARGLAASGRVGAREPGGGGHGAEGGRPPDPGPESAGEPSQEGAGPRASA